MTGLVATLALCSAVHSILHQTGTLQASSWNGDEARPELILLDRSGRPHGPKTELGAPRTELGPVDLPVREVEVVPATAGSDESPTSRYSLISAEGDRPPTRSTPPVVGREEETPEDAADRAPTFTSRPDLVASPAPSTTSNRLMVQDRDGRTVISRVHGRKAGRTLVLLPDGQLGHVDGLVPTEEPFRPATGDEMGQTLAGPGAPFEGFRVLKTKHYVVLYQSSPGFADSSAKLLENLLSGLTSALKRRAIPVTEPEFPLVAVIFRTEDDFRRFKPVGDEVRAYYEILTNRIYFYEASERDQDAPEVSALRKPQTVAHEGAHQILHNIGVQPRLGPWPLWLVEGLAEYCSPPTVNRKGVAGWAGLGQVNPIHMATIRDLADSPREPRPSPRGVRRKSQSALLIDLETLVTSTDLTPTDYAFSWALTHYLATRRTEDFLTYLSVLGRVTPLQDLEPAEHLAIFRAVFGDDLVKLERSVLMHLSRLKQGDALPYYAVMFEQQFQGGVIRRAAMVSQSPSVIREWLESMASPRGGPSQWHAQPFPSKSRALQSAETWMQEAR